MMNKYVVVNWVQILIASVMILLVGIAIGAYAEHYKDQVLANQYRLQQDWTKSSAGK